MRTRLVAFEAKRLKPGVQVYAFFDGTSVADYVKSGSHSYTPLVGINTITAKRCIASPVTTDANGTVSCTCSIPNNSYWTYSTCEIESTSHHSHTTYDDTNNT